MMKIPDIQLGKGNCVRDGGDAAVIACGLMVNEALMAAEELEKEGIMSARHRYAHHQAAG